MFRFTIRDMLWLTVVVALGAGWWIDNRQQAARNYHTEMLAWKFRTEALMSHIKDGSGGKVEFQRGRWGQEVHVQDGKGLTTYHDNRQDSATPFDP